MILEGATANTKLGEAVRNRRSLEPIFGSKFWLLQEVHRERDQLDTLLERETDLQVAYTADDMGLAIAVHKSIEVLSSNKHVIREAGRLTLLAKGLFLPGPLKFRQRARGIITATLAVGGNAVTLATGHPPIPHDRSHTGHVEAIAPILNGIQEPLVFGGDMNHWPKRQACDLQMAEDAALTWVDIGEISTWHAKKSRQKPLAIILEAFNVTWDGQLDALYVRGLGYENARVVPIGSDHEAVTADIHI